MKKILLIASAFIGATALQACSKKNKMYAAGTVPECLKTRIADFSKSGGSCETGASLKEYTFQSKTVFVFDPGHCGADMAAPVMDAQCNSIGSLGGFAGNTKINGEDFSSAVYVKTIWSN